MNNYCAEPQAHPDRCGCKPDAFQIARHSKRLVEQQRERIAALEAECERLRKQLAESRNSILVTEVCPESRSVEECIVDADSVRASWRLIRSYREQIEAKESWSAITPDYLSKEFRKARDAAGAYNDIKNPMARPTIHELRALGAWLYEQQGFAREYVQALMGHASEDMTAYYQAGHERKGTVYQRVQAGLKL